MPTVLMALSLCAATAHARAGGDAALAAPAAPTALADPLPGRLFHSPAERAALDRRTEHIPQPARRPAHLPAPAPEDSRTLTGFVLRSDGHNSYWLEAPAQVAVDPLSR